MIKQNAAFYARLLTNSEKRGSINPKGRFENYSFSGDKVHKREL